MEKLNRKWLYQLPVGYQHRAVKNLAHQSKYATVHKAFSMAQALRQSFDYKLTPEGENFWIYVETFYLGQTPLPPFQEMIEMCKNPWPRGLVECCNDLFEEPKEESSDGADWRKVDEYMNLPVPSVITQQMQWPKMSAKQILDAYQQTGSISMEPIQACMCSMLHLHEEEKVVLMEKVFKSMTPESKAKLLKILQEQV